MSNFNMPLVSIIIPIFNTEEYLEQCIESVLEQPFNDWELILVDDGSTDSSPRIIEKFVSLDYRIKSIKSNSGCVSIARNKGINNSSGKYVFFIDSDDYLSATGLTAMSNCVIENPDLQFVQGSFSVNNMYTSKIVKSGRFTNLKKYDKITLTGEDYLISLGTNVLYPFNSLISNEFIKENKILFQADLTFQEDTIFILSVLTKSSKCMYMDTDGYVYRWGRPGSLTTSIPQDETADLIKRKKRLSSIINSTVHLQNFKSSNKEVNKIIRKIIIENITGCIGGASKLLPDREIFDLLKENIKHVETNHLGIREMLAIVYNISPELSLRIRNLFNRVFS